VNSTSTTSKPGRHVGFGSDPATPTPIEIVGIVIDAKYPLARRIQPHLFFPILDGPNPRNVVVLLRTSGDPAAMMPTARVGDSRSIRSLACTTPPLEQKLDQINRQRTAPRPLRPSSVCGDAARFVGRLRRVAYMVTKRTREIGIRNGDRRARARRFWLSCARRLESSRRHCPALPVAWRRRGFRGQLYASPHRSIATRVRGVL